MSRYTLKLSVALIALSLGLSACNTPGAVPFVGTDTNQQTAQAKVKGQIILPYRPQGTRVSQGFSPLNYFFGAAAHADDIKVYVMPVTQTDLSQIRAYVNGQPVNLLVSDIRISGDQTLIDYEITNLPLLAPGQVYLLDVRLPSGDPLVGGVLNLVPGTVNTYNLTVQTTALLDRAREFLGTRPVSSLTLIDVRRLERDGEIRIRGDSIREILRRRGSLRYVSNQRFYLLLDEFDFDDRDCDKEKFKYEEKKGKVEYKYECKD
ncbi:MAG: hypothetical protein CVV27_08530 [Candidatus Melainabacteria bacterium HGW-Melainabacteria-1]|nr:MAG: hypothetical protein CVV27_08530 [Candidatus Melainabacteria bacterium HGW-Melainabacteria-1]